LAARGTRRRPKPRQLSSGDLARLCGLSKRTVVKAIADGKIRAARTVGGHYRVTLAAAREFMAARGMDTSELSAREECALVIARDRFVGDLLADVLGRAGGEVIQSRSLFEAGALAARYRPWLVVVDAAAAGPDPVAACRGIAGADPCRSSAVLVLAGGDAAERGKFRRAGVSAVLGKPFSVAQLKKAVHDLQRRGER